LIKIQLKDKIKESIRIALDCVISNVTILNLQGHDFYYFPLFLKETLPYQQSELDVCAGAMGIGIETMHPLIQQPSSREYDVIWKSCELLIDLQGESGGWPSIVPLKGIKIVRMEETVNDTFFALKSLFDIGFPSFTFADKIPITKQLQIIRNGIQWILKNKIRRAWYYVEKEFIRPEDLPQIPEVTLPSSNVLFLLYQAKESIRKFNEELKKHREINYSREVEENESLLKEICSTYSEGIQWLWDIQHPKGGYGKYRGDNPKVTNTALALRALLTDDREESRKSALKALRFLLKLKGKLRELSDEDIFEYYDQIWICKEDNNRIEIRRPIIHEKYALGLVLQALGAVYVKKYQIGGREVTLIDELNFFEKMKYKKLLNQCINELLEAQEKSGKLAGSFKGYRNVPMNYPIYAIENAISAFSILLENPNIFESRNLLKGVLGILVIAVIVLVITSFFPELYSKIVVGIISMILVWGIRKILGYFGWKI
jgi:mRNA-degrading endonuclease YafQ of YafQ-DinJ toxin-antitoxin module